MSGGGMMGGGMMGGGMGGSAEAAGNYWKTDEKKVMIRAFDFTVAARHQLPLSRAHRGLQPQLQSRGRQPRASTPRRNSCAATWSEPTDEVHMPPDVMPYAIGTDPLSPNSRHEGPVPGHPLPPRRRRDRSHGTSRPDRAKSSASLAPPRSPSPTARARRTARSTSTAIRSCWISTPTRKPADISRCPPDSSAPRSNGPLSTLLLRPDGRVAVHNEADDVTNEVRRDIEANYKHEIKQSSKKRQNSIGMGMMGMMGGGMMGRHGRHDGRWDAVGCDRCLHVAFRVVAIRTGEFGLGQPSPRSAGFFVGSGTDFVSSATVR